MTDEVIYSIYVHLPFCRSKCPYCDFYSVVLPDVPFEKYAECIQREWTERKVFLEDDPISIYIGGGTPSIWSAKNLAQLLSALPITSHTEVTVEVNPGDFEGQKANDWFHCLTDAGVNRFSIGAQAFDDKRLKWLKRRHNTKKALETIEAARRSKAKSVSVDFMYGTPGQKEPDLIDELRVLASLSADHISAYELTVAEDTDLGRSVASKEVSLPNDDEMIEMWLAIRHTIEEHSYHCYEVSNYAVCGHQCKHNEQYWRGGLYIGLGAGAHGFVREAGTYFRYSNTESFVDYMACLKSSDVKAGYWGIGKDAAFEELEPLTLAREKIMLGLRTSEGVLLGDIFAQVSPKCCTEWIEILNNAKNDGLLILNRDRAIPTEKGMLFADQLALLFF